MTTAQNFAAEWTDDDLFAPRFEVNQSIYT